MLKSPDGAKRRQQNKETGWLSNKNDILTHVGRSQLTLILNDYALPDLVFAGGEGGQVRRSVVSALAAEMAATRLEEEKRKRRCKPIRGKRRKAGRWKGGPAKRR
jgi:hypothetical protein